jgi:hypothetical protein
MFIKSIPRLKVEATKPPKSVTTPPPILMITLFLSAPYSDKVSQSPKHMSRFLDSSPGSISKIS